MSDETSRLEINALRAKLQETTKALSNSRDFISSLLENIDEASGLTPEELWINLKIKINRYLSETP